jgi:hypothetical protein
MALAGVGAGTNELTALAATTELAPTAKRGKYFVVLIFTISPFCPPVPWAKLSPTIHFGGMLAESAESGRLSTLL